MMCNYRDELRTAQAIENWSKDRLSDYDEIREEVMKDPDVITRVQQYEAEKNSKILPSSKRKVEKELESYIDSEVLKRRRAYNKKKYSTKERVYRKANDVAAIALTVSALFG